jgi:peptidyl-prolyl cis-trans isomerase A (cyclophilin A)
MLLVACALVVAGACSEKKKPEPKPQGSAAEVSKAEPPTKVRRPEGVEKVDGYEIIRAKTKSGETAELKVKPPKGWSIMRAPDGPDPHGGEFTLQEATAGMPAAEKGATLAAMIKTTMGSFYCDLYPDEAPNTVANFVGLARGKRTFWDRLTAEWTARPYYDGTTFHRVIPGFMIQGGDHTGTGQGMIGYRIPDEVHPKLKHDRPGQLCMANRGPNTGEAQFFITEVPTPHLDGSYTIFGQCEPATLVQRIARVPQTGPPKNNPRTPVTIEKVEIRRVVGGAKKWMPDSAKLPPLPNLPAPGRAVQVGGPTE